MNLYELLAKLSEKGVKLWLEGDQLRIRAPKGVLTSDLRQLLAEYKPDLIRVLSQSDSDGSTIKQPLVTIPRDGKLPLSFEQEWLFSIAQLLPNQPIHNMVQAIKLTGKLSVPVLQQSLNLIIQRHESLRTTFALEEGKPGQQVRPAFSVQLSLRDRQGLTAAEQEEALEQLAQQESQQPFDLAHGPLVRFNLLQLEETENILLMTFHHLVFDLFSSHLFLRELASCYEAILQDNFDNLTPLPIQYGDFAFWQQQWLEGEFFHEQLSYWKTQLSKQLSPLELPSDRSRSSLRSFQSAHQPLNCSPSLWSGLKSLSRQEGVTPFVTLLAAFKVLLHRYSGQTDICLGSPVTGRVHPQLESLIGCFAYPLVLRSDLSHNPPFRELLKRVRQVVLDAQANQKIPFGKMIEFLPPEMRKQANPLAIEFSFIKKQLESMEVSNDLRLTPMTETARGIADIDLLLTMYEEEETLKGLLQYDLELFEATTIGEMIGNFQKLLAGVVANPDEKIDRLPLLTEIKPRQLPAPQLPLKITASFTAEPVENVLAFWGQKLNIPFQIEFTPYNQVFQQLLDPSSQLLHNYEGINVVLVCFEDWQKYKQAQEQEVNSWADGKEEIEHNVRELIQALRSAARQASIPYLVCLCPPSPKLQEDQEKAEWFQNMEQQMASELAPISNIYLSTSSELAALYPVKDYYDPDGAVMGHIPYTPAFFTALGTLLARKLYAIKNRPYKVIALDCDQTLWQGVCGEDGAAGVKIDFPWQKLQEKLVTQQQAGKLICLCSKNIETDVWSVFDYHQSMPLKKDQILSWRINWQPKSANLQSLAQELDLGLDSFIFIDDNPVEIAEVRANCPEVLAIQLPEDPSEIPKFVEHLWAFDGLKLTAEDRQRTEMYRQNQQRESLRQESLTFEDFIASLKLMVEIEPMTEAQLPRASQLTQRTNQFNATTIRRSQGELEELSASGQLEALTVKVSDRFGDYSLVGLMLFNSGSESLKIDTLLLSCRVLGRGVEHKMLTKLATVAQERGLQWVEVPYMATQKNQPVLNFLNQVGETYRQETREGFLFRFRVEAICNLTLPKAATQSLPEKSVKQSQSHTRAPSQTLEVIATELSEVSNILREVESWQRRERPSLAQEFVAPRNPVEQLLADIWQEILSLEKVGIYDNFFQLGGNSLLAIQAVSKIRSNFSVDLPLNSLFEFPTLADFARAIDTVRQSNLNGSTDSTLSPDLESEAVLDSTIRPDGIAYEYLTTEPKSIFLTGATGFLGSYLLYELLNQTSADIYCLIRSSDTEAAKEKIQAKLRSYYLWNEQFSSRIIPVMGDLSQPLLGISEQQFQSLASKIDVIYHNGALVNFIYPYSVMKPPNVLGTQEILRLASLKRVKPVHYVSTRGVFTGTAYSQFKIVKESDPLNYSQGLNMGYTQSKWVAEKLVMQARERGIPVSIYRPGTISGHSKTGITNTDDFFARVFKSCLQLGIMPEKDMMVEMIPVDYISQAIVYLSRQPESLGKAFHLVNPSPLPLSEFAQWLREFGYVIESMPYDRWQTELIAQLENSPENALYSFLPLFKETGTITLEFGVEFDSQNTLDGLSNHLSCPPVDSKLLETYFTYLIESGFFPRVPILLG